MSEIVENVVAQPAEKVEENAVHGFDNADLVTALAAAKGSVTGTTIFRIHLYNVSYLRWVRGQSHLSPLALIEGHEYAHRVVVEFDKTGALPEVTPVREIALPEKADCRCGGSGKYWRKVETANGVEAVPDVCYGCQGKGFCDPADQRRNYGYWAYYARLDF